MDMKYWIGDAHLLHYYIHHDILRHNRQQILADRNVLDRQPLVRILGHCHHFHIDIRYKMPGCDQLDRWFQEHCFQLDNLKYNS